MSVRFPTAVIFAFAVTSCIPLDSGTKGEEPLGSFSFLATSVADTCLSTRFAASLTFPADLSRTKETLYFTGPGGTIRGTITGKTFAVTFGGIEAIDRACSVQRDETLSGTLEATSFTGSYLTRVIPIQGSNCAAAVFGPARQFATLPCEVRYQVQGQRLDTPDGGADGGVDDGGMPAADGGG